MKHKIKPIDISIVSSYMGRFQTGIVTALVFAIAFHALLTRGSDVEHLDVFVGVTNAERFHEPLREVLSEFTKRRVRFVPGENTWDPPCELYVLRADDFMRLRGPLGLRALFALGAAANDRAVLIARGEPRGEPRVDPATIRLADVLFGEPTSPNACWAQLVALSESGVEMPDRLQGLQFAPTGADGIRVVYSVVHGVCRLGACRSSDIAALVERGELRPGEVTVVLDAPALPEIVVASSREKSAYFAGKLGGIGALVRDSPSSLGHDAIDLLVERGIASFHPVSPAHMAALEAAYEFASTRLGGE